MPTISSSTDIAVPADFAIACLETMLEKRRSQSGNLQLRLEVPLSDHGFALQKTVELEAHLQREAHAPVIAVSWAPEGRIPFPRFRGKIRSTSLGTDASTLTIEGEYHVPGQIAGALFDVAIGSTLARSTMRRLLKVFRRSIEADFRRRDG